MSRDPLEPKKRSTLRPNKFFQSLMEQKEQQMHHQVTVTAEVHKPAQRTPVQRKQPTPKLTSVCTGQVPPASHNFSIGYGAFLSSRASVGTIHMGTKGVHVLSHNHDLCHPGCHCLCLCPCLKGQWLCLCCQLLS